MAPGAPYRVVGLPGYYYRRYVRKIRRRGALFALWISHGIHNRTTRIPKKPIQLLRKTGNQVDRLTSLNMPPYAETGQGYGSRKSVICAASLSTEKDVREGDTYPLATAYAY